jgi:hypothetical protein
LTWRWRGNLGGLFTCKTKVTKINVPAVLLADAA